MGTSLFPKDPEPSERKCLLRRDVLQSPPSSLAGASLPPSMSTRKDLVYKLFYNLFSITRGFVSTLKALFEGDKGSWGAETFARDGMGLLLNHHLHHPLLQLRRQTVVFPNPGLFRLISCLISSRVVPC